jgi:hypothetical protein
VRLSALEKHLGFFVGHGPQRSIGHGAFVPAQSTGCRRRKWSQARDGDAAADDGDGFAVLGKLDKPGELGFGFVDGDFQWRRF